MTSLETRFASEECCYELTVAECCERVLADHGIGLTATVPGGPLMPLLRAFHQAGRMQTVLARHECGAAMIAEGYYRVARKPAALAVTAGPGVSNAVTGIALAHAEQSPMVVFSAQVATDWQGRGAAQELDTVSLLKPITKLSESLSEPQRTQAVLEHLIGVARSGRRGPVHLSVPANVWGMRTTYRSAAPRVQPYTQPRVTGHDLRPLARSLSAAKAPCVLVGYGTVQAQAERELLELAARYPRLRVACTPRAKGAFPEPHAQSLGVFGFAGHRAAEAALLVESDLVLVLGSRLGEITSLGWDARLGQRRLVQVDLDAEQLGKNFPIELGVLGDIRDVLTALIRCSPDGGASRHAVLTPAAVQPRDASELLKPSALMAAMNQVLVGNEHLFVDIGNCMAWAINRLRRPVAQRWHVNLMYGCMGHALPAAIGGALAGSGPSVVVVGDAAFAMTGSELHTAVEHRLPVVVVVLNDGGHGMVDLGCRVQFGPNALPSYRFSQRLDARGMAAAMGAHAAEIHSEDELTIELAAALKSSKPTLLDVRIDPAEVPPFGSRMDALRQNFAAAESSARAGQCPAQGAQLELCSQSQEAS